MAGRDRCGGRVIRRFRLAIRSPPSPSWRAASRSPDARASDGLATQYRAGTGQNYIAGDGRSASTPPATAARRSRFTGTLRRRQHRLAPKQYAGKVLVVNFWYAGCPPCRVEAPDLEALYQKYAAEGVGFLGVNLYDADRLRPSFEKDKGVTYPSVLDRDTGSVLLAFSKTVPPKATPTTLVIDKKGRVAARILGALPGKGILDSLISDAVAEH